MIQRNGLTVTELEDRVVEIAPAKQKKRKKNFFK